MSDASKEETKRPHDSAYVWSSTKGKHWYNGFVSLTEKERGRAEFIILALLLIFAVFGGSFGGYVIYTTVVSPPAQLYGSCPPPAFISGNNCLQKVCSVPQGSQQEVCVYEQTGNVIGPLKP